MIGDHKVYDLTDTSNRFRLLSDGCFYVYVFRDAWGEAIYVGQTGNAFQRISQHATSKPWYDLAASLELIECADRREALDLERDLIRSLSPRENIAYRADLAVAS